MFELLNAVVVALIVDWNITIGGPIQCVVSYRDQCARKHTSYIIIYYIIIRVHSAFSLVASCVLLKYTRTDDVS